MQQGEANLLDKADERAGYRKLLEQPAGDGRLAYRIDDFCRAIGLGRTKVYALIADGTLRTVVIGGRRLVPRDAAEALLSQGATDGRAA
jgi:excisionase family DNA binding protein